MTENPPKNMKTLTMAMLREKIRFLNGHILELGAAIFLEKDPDKKAELQKKLAELGAEKHQLKGLYMSKRAWKPDASPRHQKNFYTY